MVGEKKKMNGGLDENFNYASGGNDDEQFIQNEKLK